MTIVMTVDLCRHFRGVGQLLAEDRRPDESLWSQPLISSRLLELRDLDESQRDGS